MCGNRPALLNLVDLQDGWVWLPEQEHRGEGAGVRGTASVPAMP